MSEPTPRSSVYPWAVLLAFVGLSAWANSLHAPDDWTLRFVAGLVPVSAALCWHLLVRPGLAQGWRRVLSRSTALAVFAFTMWASFGSLTAIGVRAGLHPPESLAAALDGLAVVAALSVWNHVARDTGTAQADVETTETTAASVPAEDSPPAPSVPIPNATSPAPKGGTGTAPKVVSGTTRVRTRTDIRDQLVAARRIDAKHRAETGKAAGRRVLQVALGVGTARAGELRTLLDEEAVAKTAASAETGA